MTRELGAAPTRARRRFRGAEVGIWPFSQPFPPGPAYYLLLCSPRLNLRRGKSGFLGADSAPPPPRCDSPHVDSLSLSLSSLFPFLFFSTMRDVEFFL